MIGVLFAGSTLVTPLYVIYKHAFSLTLIYAVFALAALYFGMRYLPR